MFEGLAMNNLSFSYVSFGRHADALVFREKVLEFRRRVLPEDHPNIGEADCMIDNLHLLIVTRMVLQATP